MGGQGRAANLRVTRVTRARGRMASRVLPCARALCGTDGRFPLEWRLTGGFLCAVRRPRLVTGITSGVIPAAATTGMLFGYGIRFGAAAGVFQAIGSVLVGSAGKSATGTWLAAAVGMVLHVAATLACGIAYAALAGESEDHPVAWAIAIGAAASAIAFLAVRTFAGSIALVLTPGNLIAIGAVIAITLPIGMRFAPTRL